MGVKIDEDNLKILDDLPSSAVEMQVKSKVSNHAIYVCDRNYDILLAWLSPL